MLILELMLNTYTNSTTGVLLFFLQYNFKNTLFLPNLPYNLSKGDVIDCTINLKDCA
jgi:hypothetical protein